MIPPWLEKHLTELGRWNTDGISRSIGSGMCKQCGALVLRGLDADITGLPTIVDVIEIDQLGEVVVLIQGRSTYSIDRYLKPNKYIGWQLNRRYRRSWPQGRIAVVPSHVCGSVTPRRLDPVMLKPDSVRLPGS